MGYKINDFLKSVEPQIVQRGKDYYYNDMVGHLKRSGNEFTAKVFGSESRPYHVEISFSEDGQIETWECDCPYDWGDVCKHVVAVLLAIENNDCEEQPLSTEQPDTSTNKLENLANQADAGQLRKLILRQCKKDQRFRLEALSFLSGPGNEELAAVKN